jgi:hypothetical protein
MSVMTRLLLKAVVPRLIIAMALIGAMSASEAYSDTVAAAKVEIMGQIPHPLVGNVPIEYMTWCYDKKPAVAFVDKMKVLRVGFDGAREEVLQADENLSPTSLRCSEDHNVVAVFSYDGSKLFIAAGGRVGRYKTPVAGRHGYLLRGKFLSPDGSSIVLPFGLSFLGGEDVLQSMRLIQLAGDRYAWFNDVLLYLDADETAIHSNNLADGTSRKLADLSDLYKTKKVNLAGLDRCSNRFVASVFAKIPKVGLRNAALIGLAPPSNQQLYESSSSTISLSGSGGVCVIAEARQAGEDEAISYKMETERGGFGVLAVPPFVHLADYVRISGRDCLVLGLQYPQSSSPGGPSQANVVGLRIVSPDYCRPR